MASNFRRAIVIWILYSLLLDPVSATSFDDFVNNLSTDLAPLVSLFGDQVTKQFLSESTSVLDNIIFALAPLGILTAVVSAIRVGTSLSLKAFIGRAQEGRGEAEAELLPCTSDTVSELWQDGGTARILGEPKILEVVKRTKSLENAYKPGGDAGLYQLTDVFLQWANKKIQASVEFLDSDKFSSFDDDASDHNGTAVPALSATKEKLDSIWTVDEYRGRKIDLESEDPFEVETGEQRLINHLTSSPNLALNVGRQTRPDWWNFSVLCIGILLQSGVLVYAALTTYWTRLREHLIGRQAQPWAFPISFVGTVLVCLGMYLCAHLISSETNELFFHRNIDTQGTGPEIITRHGDHKIRQAISDGEIFWLQKEQSAGDQTFKAYVGRSLDSSTHVKSTRAARSRTESPSLKLVELYLAVGMCMSGFVLQFVGLRYLHPSVALANLGSTLVMSICRATLRTQRETASINELDIFKKTRQNGLELQHFARILADYDTMTLELAPFTKPVSGDRTYASSCSGEKLFRTYLGLQNLHGAEHGWVDPKIHESAIRLKAAIEALAQYASENSELGSSWFEMQFSRDEFNVHVLRKPTYCSGDNHSYIFGYSKSSSRCIIKSRNEDDPAPVLERIPLPIDPITASSEVWNVDLAELEALLAFIYSSRVTGVTAGSSPCRRVVSIYDENDQKSKDLAWSEWNLWMTDNQTYRGPVVVPDKISNSERMPNFNDCSMQPESSHWHHGPRTSPPRYAGLHNFNRPEHFGKSAKPSLILYQSTNDDLLMCAQDLFTAYLVQMAKVMKPLNSSDIIIPREFGYSRRCKSQRLEDICNIFVLNQLGTKRDALCCIYPALKCSSRQPDLALCWPSIRPMFEERFNQNSRQRAMELYWWFIASKSPQSNTLANDLAYRILLMLSDPSIEIKIALETEARTKLVYLVNPSVTNVSTAIKIQILWILSFILEQQSLEHSQLAFRRILDECKCFEIEPLPFKTSLPNVIGLTLINRRNFGLIIKYLISSRCISINTIDNHSRTFLSWACEHQDQELAHWLVSNGADPNHGALLHRPVVEASKKGDDDVLKILIETNRCDLGERGPGLQKIGTIAMIAALNGGYLSCLLMLIHQEDVFYTDHDENGSNIIHLVVIHGSLAAFDSLTSTKKFKSNPECLLQTNYDGYTPLDLIQQASHIVRQKLARILLQVPFHQTPETNPRRDATFEAIKSTIIAIRGDLQFDQFNRAPKWWEAHAENNVQYGSEVFPSGVEELRGDRRYSTGGTALSRAS